MLFINNHVELRSPSTLQLPSAPSSPLLLIEVDTVVAMVMGELGIDGKEWASIPVGAVSSGVLCAVDDCYLV